MQPLRWWETGTVLAKARCHINPRFKRILLVGCPSKHSNQAWVEDSNHNSSTVRCSRIRRCMDSNNNDHNNSGKPALIRAANSLMLNPDISPKALQDRVDFKISSRPVTCLQACRCPNSTRATSSLSRSSPRIITLALAISRAHPRWRQETSRVDSTTVALSTWLPKEKLRKVSELEFVTCTLILYSRVYWRISN